jgi:hypothetical protein
VPTFPNAAPFPKKWPRDEIQYRHRADIKTLFPLHQSAGRGLNTDRLLSEWTTDMSQRRSSEEHAQNGNHITRTGRLADLASNNGTTQQSCAVPQCRVDLCTLWSRKVTNRREYCAVVLPMRARTRRAHWIMSLKLLRTLKE